MGFLSALFGAQPKQLTESSERKIGEVFFDFSTSYVNVKFDSLDSRELGANLLLSSYVLFLARFFYICDEREIEPMRQFVSAMAQGQYKQEELVLHAWDSVIPHLSEEEAKNATALYSGNMMPLPPLTFSENKDITGSITQYRLELYRINEGFGHKFYLSVGPDIILLPLLVAYYYQYVSSKLKTNEEISFFNDLILDFLDVSADDCRADNALHQIPYLLLKNARVN